jgi:ppGpp synthetase/RelA/SpoT-type nucleotidyltranferase
VSRDIFPENSKSAVNRAGSRLARGEAADEDLRIIENWRAAHNYILNTFQANLRLRAKKINMRTPVQRIKRLETIKNKLSRFPDMQFARMHDIVGCRVIFESEFDLNIFRNSFNQSRFAHRRRLKILSDGTKADAYNYIKIPKPSGYRGIHDVFEYRAKQAGRGRASGGEKWNGLNIEIQYRTTVQHAWATAVEICDNFTDNHGKFSNAPDDYLRYFLLASEMLARQFEPTTPRQLDSSNEALLSEFQFLEQQHGMLQTLRGIQPSQQDFAFDKHTLLIFTESYEETEVRTFSDFRSAVQAYFELERTKPNGVDVVLVAADDPESVRFGFKNYFSDAREFVSLIDKCLSGLSEPPQ